MSVLVLSDILDTVAVEVGWKAGAVGFGRNGGALGLIRRMGVFGA